MLDRLDFTALRCRVGLVEVLGEDVDHGRAEAPVGKHVLDDGTAWATLDREGEEKLDDVRVAIPGSRAESVVVIGRRVDATLQRQIEEKLDDVRVANIGSDAKSVVVIRGRVDATLLKEVSHRGDEASKGSLGERGCFAGHGTCLAQVLQHNVSVLDHVPLFTNSSARRLLPAPIPICAAKGVDLARPVKARLREDGDS